MAVHAGSWLGLPDFGITEAIGSALKKPTTAQGGSNLFGGTQQAATPAKQVLGASYNTTPAGPPGPPAGYSSGGGNYNIPQSATPSGNQGYQQIQQGQDNGNSQIESDYNQSMGMLDSAQQGLQGQANTANQTIDQQFGAAQNEIGNAQSTATNAQNASLATAEKQGTSAVQQARDLYSQTQQANNAQLSALGLSSSSVSEALAERLGVETARRIAGVTGSLQEVRQNTVNELGRIKTYYEGKVADLQNQAAVQKSQIQNSLVQGLNQINQARGQAASDKAQARSNLLSQVQNQIGALTMQQQQFEQSLQQWATQKSAALTPLTTNQGLQQAFQNFVSLTQSGQFNPQQFSAGVNVNANDQPSYHFGTINSNTKKTDPLQALYDQVGVTRNQ